VRSVKCKTKPISGGKRLGAGRTNKANSPPRGAKRAKQTQFPTGGGSDAACAWDAGQSCETKPILAALADEIPHYSIIQPSQADGDCAKRTQF
jgi:hypothetical protein